MKSHDIARGADAVRDETERARMKELIKHAKPIQLEPQPQSVYERLLPSVVGFIGGWSLMKHLNKKD